MAGTEAVVWVDRRLGYVAVAFKVTPRHPLPASPEFVERRDVGQPRECLFALGFECTLAEMLVHSRSPFCQASASSRLVSVRSASAAASFNAAVMASSSSMADQRW